jgi:peroxiredoxin
MIGAWLVGTVGIAWLVVAGLLSARPTVDSDVTLATPFTLPATDGSTVSLESFRGSPVLLYFSEGAGCDACILQMAAIEQDPEFADAGIVVLPIVMNRQAEIESAMMRADVMTPFLMDDGRISEAYGTLGTGMHASLPGHGFVLVNADGQQVWSANYPSMWIEPQDLFNLIEGQL